MAQHGDLLIRGGTVVDPASGLYGQNDILICGNTIAAIDPASPPQAREVIDAGGCLVLPGLIDYHTHIFPGGTESGFVPDVSLLPMGVTTAVDQGSAGAANADLFMRAVAAGSRLRVFCTLNVSPAGQVTERYPENVDPRHYDPARLKALFARYGSSIVGLKLRHGREVVGPLGLEPLRATVRLAEELACRVVVHATDPPATVAELAALLRPGDVYCHCYHGKGSTILGEDGKVRPEIRAARQQGVLFDTADARVNHSYPVIRAALADGFFPDIISTDLTRASLFGNMVFGLPLVMSKYLGLGLPLPDIVRACTAAPAELLGMGGRLGTLRPGALADVAIFKLADKPFVLTNRAGETLRVEKLFLPKVTILNGEIVFRQLDFPYA